MQISTRDYSLSCRCPEKWPLITNRSHYFPQRCVPSQGILGPCHFPFSALSLPGLIFALSAIYGTVSFDFSEIPLDNRRLILYDFVRFHRDALGPSRTPEAKCLSISCTKLCRTCVEQKGQNVTFLKGAKPSRILNALRWFANEMCVADLLRKKLMIGQYADPR